LIRLLPLLIALPATAQTLPELATRALDADPGVRATAAALRAADERLFQAKAAYGPTANVTVTSNKSRSARHQPTRSAANA
jgi:outer membrane protein